MGYQKNFRLIMRIKNISVAMPCITSSFLSILCVTLYLSIFAITASAETNYVARLGQLMLVKPGESCRIKVEVVSEPPSRLKKRALEIAPNVKPEWLFTQNYNICMKGEKFFMSVCPLQVDGECKNYFHDGTFFYLLYTGNSRIYLSSDLEGLSADPSFSSHVKALFENDFIAVDGEGGNESKIGIAEIISGLAIDLKPIYKRISDESFYSVAYNKQMAEELGVDRVLELTREAFIQGESSIVKITVSVEILDEELDESLFIPHEFGDKNLFYGDGSPLFVRDFLPPIDQIKKIIKSNILRDEYSREARERPKVISDFKYRADDICHECR